MIGGTKPMKMAVESAKKMKAEKAMKLKEEAAMKKKAMPDFPDVDGDGNTTESIKSATASVKSGSSPDKMKEKAMKLKSTMKMKEEKAMKMKEPMKMKEEKTPMKDDEGKKKKSKVIAELDTSKPHYKYSKTTAYKDYIKKRNEFNRKNPGHDMAYKPFEGKKYNQVEMDPETNYRTPISREGGKSAKPMKKDPAMKLKEKPMKMKKGEAMKMKKDEAMKMKTPMKNGKDKYFSLANLKEAGKVLKATLSGKTVTAVPHSSMVPKTPKPTMNVNKPKTPKSPKKPKARF